jgi:hypothetical protein
MKKAFFTMAFGLMSAITLAAPLEVNGPFYRQLVATGYTLEEVGEFTFAKRGVVTVLVSESDNSTWIGRMFNVKATKDIDKQLRIDALDAINSANLEFSFTTSLGDGSIICGIQMFGEYSPSTYGIGLSEIEKCNFLFDKYPVLFKLSP